MPERSPPVRVPDDALPGGRAAAAVAASALAAAMWLVRLAWAGPELWFLGWNLLLAWIPWLSARAIARASGRRALAALSGVWLLFLPNAPYLVTDLVHLRPRPPVPATYDVLLFASFTLAGCALAWGSLELVHRRLVRAAGRAGAAAAIGLVLLLSGFGVYLGRFGRWNSWDVLLRPGAVLADAAGALVDPRALAFSLLFAAFLGAGYLLVEPPRAAEALDRDGPGGRAT
jgi:uncharacterized membrane protein